VLALALRFRVLPSHREAQGSRLAVEETVLHQLGKPSMTGKGQAGVTGAALVPGSLQKEPLHSDILLSAAVMVVGWVRLWRTGVEIPGG